MKRRIEKLINDIYRLMPTQAVNNSNEDIEETNERQKEFDSKFEVFRNSEDFTSLYDKVIKSYDLIDNEEIFDIAVNDRVAIAQYKISENLLQQIELCQNQLLKYQDYVSQTLNDSLQYIRFRLYREQNFILSNMSESAKIDIFWKPNNQEIFDALKEVTNEDIAKHILVAQGETEIRKYMSSQKRYINHILDNAPCHGKKVTHKNFYDVLTKYCLISCGNDAFNKWLQ